MAMVGTTKIVVTEHFKYAAVGDAAAGALIDHAVEFGLQFAQQTDASAYVLPVAAGNGVDLGAGAVAFAGEVDEFADLLDGETELAGVADEVQTLAVGAGVAPLAARGAGAGHQQALVLVVAQGLDVDTGLFRELADRERVWVGHVRLNLQGL